MKFSASLMCGNTLNLRQDVAVLESSNLVDYLHVDVSDGLFADNIIFGYETIKQLGDFALPRDVHLMMLYPSKSLPHLALSARDRISFHLECDENIHDVIKNIRTYGNSCKAGLVVKKTSNIDDTLPYIGDIDHLYFMTASIGRAGNIYDKQRIQYIVDNIKMLRSVNKNLVIGVDGGVTFKLIEELKHLGVKQFVLGTNTLYTNSLCDGIARLRAFVQHTS